MFPALPPAEMDEAMLGALAEAMIARAEDADPENVADPEENSGISAGYTYFGQFIDHDLSFDPASSLQQQNDPDALEDYRTPRFDLDCVYGRGPDDQPYLYEQDGRHMVLCPSAGGAPTLPRGQSSDGQPGRALIGDPRNDENVIVSQLHTAVIGFHNRMVELMRGANVREVQQQVRWHYQWVVLKDFLPTIVGQETVDDVLGRGLRFFNPGPQGYMPVEFSVAAYRFGHSMVRPIYRLNTSMKDRVPLFPRIGGGERGTRGLIGFGPIPDKLEIDWGLFFKTDEERPMVGKRRVQPAYKPDTSLVDPLKELLPAVVQSGPPSLALRNLLRGLRMSLPSGQTVAKAMGVRVLTDDELLIGKDTRRGRKQPLKKISDRFAGNAPLWTYVLAETQKPDADDDVPRRLGDVGGRIVAEVMIGLMLADKHSFLNQYPNFQPSNELCADPQKFKIVDFIRAGQRHAQEVAKALRRPGAAVHAA
jgi:hypothetical protein